jgi:hypothetical protein
MTNKQLTNDLQMTIFDENDPIVKNVLQSVKESFTISGNGISSPF